MFGFKRLSPQQKTIRELRTQLEEKKLRALNKLFEESFNVEPEADEAAWSLIGTASRLVGGLQELFAGSVTRQAIRTMSRKLELTNSHYKRLLRNCVTYIIGSGITCGPAKDSRTYQRDSEQWEVFRRRNNFLWRQKEFVKRAFRDGEVFLRIMGSGAVANVRFLEPEWVRDKSGDENSGIVTASGDVESIEAYRYTPNINGSMASSTEDIPAEQVVFRKLSVDASVLRGIPYFWAEMKRCNDYKTWMDYQLLAMKIATAIVLLRKHKASPSQIEAYANAMKWDEETDSTTGETIRKERIRPGSIYDVGINEEWNFLSPTIDAKIIEKGGRGLLLSVAAGAGQSEVMVTADASNANFASTMVAENPAIMDYKDWQMFFGEAFIELYRKVMGVDESSTEQPTFTTPEILSRDIVDEAKAKEIEFMHDVISLETWREETGRDPDRERDRVLAEQAERMQQSRRQRVPQEETPEQTGEE